MEQVFYIAGGIVVIAGLVGVFLPFVPGVPVVFLGLIIASIGAGFGFISIWTIVGLALLTCLSVAVDHLAGVLGAKFAGSTILGLCGAILGALFGISVFGPIGIIIGPAIGVFIFELISRRNIRTSSRAAGYTLFSTIAGMFINLIIALVMIGVFIGSIFV